MNLAWTKSARLWGWVATSVVVALAIKEAWPALSAPAIPFDDSFISFRYADNLVRGRGLVYNPGEPVEGYTNFLWTLLVAVGISFKQEPLEFAGLLGTLSFVGCIALTALIVRSTPSRNLRALVGLGAVFWVAMPEGFAAFAKCGLETLLVCVLVLASGWTAHAGKGGQGLFGSLGWRGDWLYSLAPTALILTRLDGAVFVGTSGLILGLQAFRNRLRQDEQPLERGWRALATRVLRALQAALRMLLQRYALMLVVLGVWLAWKVGYYGELLPNTYYAKAGDHSNWGAGLAYGQALVRSYPHVLGLAALAAVGAGLSPEGAPRTLGLWAVSSLSLFAIYVAKVGGDFMHYRFAFEAYPLLCAAAGIGLSALAERATLTALGLAVVLTSTATGAPIMEDRFGMQDLNLMRKFWHDGSRTGPYLKKALPENAVISISNAGMAYYADRTAIDEWGLNDREVAHQPGQMAHRGHVKRASREYLEKRRVNLVLTHPWDVPCRKRERAHTRKLRPTDLPLVWLKIDKGDCIRMDYLTQTPELTDWFCAHREHFVTEDLACPTPEPPDPPGRKKRSKKNKPKAP